MENYNQIKITWVGNFNLFVLCFVFVQLLSHVNLFAAPWAVERQASLSITVSRSLFMLMSISCPLNSILLLYFYFYFGKSSWIEVYFMSKIVCSTDL